MSRRGIALSCLLAFVSLYAVADTAHGARQLRKKLIQYGWGIPTPDYIRKNIRTMEKRPFDGLIFQLRGGRNVLDPKAWPEKRFAADFANCAKIKWKRFTDNFVIMLAASKQDWFNDEDWQAIVNNVRLVAHGARLAHCVGVCLDPEPYGFNPWSYRTAAHRDTKTFAEYEAKVRQRGAQFIRAVESELPGARIMTFFQLSYFRQLLVAMDPKERAKLLAGMRYSFLPAFLNGMLDAASPQVRIIDGNEGSYYYTKSEQYLANYFTVTQSGLLLIDPKNWQKYRDQVEVGNALYVDQYFGLRTNKVLGSFLKPTERAQWFEHNVYWALRTSDCYVWCYGERMNWFRNENIPPGSEAAIRAARAELDAGKPCGIDMKPIVEAGTKRLRAEERKRLKVRSADILRLPVGVPEPTIDGTLNDPAWRRVPPLAPFVALASRPRKLGASTKATVTWDRKALYIGVLCEEPHPNRLDCVGVKHDDPVWQGDDVEVMIAAPGKPVPFYHFIVNPKGVYWDARHTPDVDLAYDPQWQHAAKVSGKAWTVEMAIPWKALNMTPPKVGTVLHADICRQRSQGHELSAWSPMANGFLEYQLYGTWTLK